MLRIKTFFVLLFFCFALTTSSAKGTPDWVTVPSKAFPSNKYLTSVGSAKDRSSAELKAIQGIAALFKQSIKSNEKATTSISQARQNDRTVITQNSNFDQKVLRSVDSKNLLGVEVKEFWQDEKNNTWYAIAVMDKEKASALYTDLIKANISSANKSLDKIADNSMDSYYYCDFAKNIAIENESLYERLSLIKPEAANAIKDEMISSKKITLRQTEIANNIPICIIIENDMNGRFAQAFAKVLSDKGFKTSFNTSDRYMIAGNATFTESTTSDKTTVHCRYSLDTYLADSKTGKNLVPFSLSGREAHVQYSEAKERAAKSIEKKILSNFAASLDTFFNQN